MEKSKKRKKYETKENDTKIKKTQKTAVGQIEYLVKLDPMVQTRYTLKEKTFQSTQKYPKIPNTQK